MFEFIRIWLLEQEVEGLQKAVFVHSAASFLQC